MTENTPDAVPYVFAYRNWRGEISERRVTPSSVWFGTTDWHPEPQWFMHAYDHDKGARREFAMRDIGARAMQAAMPAPAGVRVRDLVWKDHNTAACVLGIYYIGRIGGEWELLFRPSPLCAYDRISSGIEPNFEAALRSAQAAAQADYERRICSAIAGAGAQEGANAEHRKGLSDSGKDVSGNRERVVNATPAGAGDLVERGRKASAVVDSYTGDKCLIRDLTDRIEALEAEVARLRGQVERERATSTGEWASQRENDALTIRYHEMKARATTAESDLAALRAEVERKDKALREAGEAIAEYFRYLNGGETRGSYDGKPEREGLRKAGYAVSRALAPAKAGG